MKYRPGAKIARIFFSQKTEGHKALAHGLSRTPKLDFGQKIWSIFKTVFELIVLSYNFLLSDHVFCLIPLSGNPLELGRQRKSFPNFSVSGSHDMYVLGASSFMIRRCLEQTAGSHVTEGWFWSRRTSLKKKAIEVKTNLKGISSSIFIHLLQIYEWLFRGFNSCWMSVSIQNPVFLVSGSLNLLMA